MSHVSRCLVYRQREWERNKNIDSSNQAIPSGDTLFFIPINEPDLLQTLFTKQRSNIWASRQKATKANVLFIKRWCDIAPGGISRGFVCIPFRITQPSHYVKMIQCRLYRIYAEIAHASITAIVVGGASSPDLFTLAGDCSRVTFSKGRPALLTADLSENYGNFKFIKWHSNS